MNIICDRCGQPITSEEDRVLKDTFNFHKVCPADTPHTLREKIVRTIYGEHITYKDLQNGMVNDGETTEHADSLVALFEEEINKARQNGEHYAYCKVRDGTVNIDKAIRELERALKPKNGGNDE